MANQTPSWDNLRERYSPALVKVIRGHFDRGPFRLNAHELAIEANVDDAVAANLLGELVSVGVLTVEGEYRCPCQAKEVLTQQEAVEDVCVHCGKAFEQDVPGKPVKLNVYIHKAPETRDVRWLLALHGMNTTGAWQEAFNWLVSRSYRRSVPVAIYKYGVVRPGALLKFRLRALAHGLNARIRRLSGQTEETGFGGTPDVIAHSLGTWLLGHALLKDPNLRVGRVILTGCVLRPDFNWALLFQRKQVEAVLCHVATKDFWAQIAHYVIPDSGPSGRRGFNDRARVSHVVLARGHHSDFFAETVMPQLFTEIWQHFLRERDRQVVGNGDALPAPDWEQAWWPLRATVPRLILLILVGVLFFLAGSALALGAVDLWHLI